MANYKKDIQNAGNGYSRKIYFSERKNVKSFRTVKKFNTTEDMAAFVGVKVSNVDESSERKNIVKIVLSRLKSYKNHKIHTYSMTNETIKDFINGDYDETTIASLDWSD